MLRNVRGIFVGLGSTSRGEPACAGMTEHVSRVVVRGAAGVDDEMRRGAMIFIVFLLLFVGLCGWLDARAALRQGER